MPYFGAEFVSDAEFKGLVDEVKRLAEEEAAHAAEVAECEAGTCSHYTCTEGRSLDEWDEPEPTRWDYYSEGGFSDR